MPVHAALAGGDVDRALVEYDRHAELRGSSPELLRAIALQALLQSAASADSSVRRAAVQQLKLAGSHATETLELVAASLEYPLTAAEALSALAQRGDRHAEARLYAHVDDENSAIRALALSVADPQADRDLLLQELDSPHAAVRKAAARRLGFASTVGLHEVRLKLEVSARSDPDAGVRGAAIWALGHFGRLGRASLPVIRERLSDEAPAVRMAAVSALLRVDRRQGAALIEPLLGQQPSQASIEAARLLATLRNDTTPGVAESARAFLRQALRAPQPKRRAQAAVAVLSLPANFDWMALFLDILPGESDRPTRLALAAALHRGGHSAGTEALGEMMGGEDIPAVQAAIALAPDEAAVAALLAVANNSERDPRSRHAAARGLAREGRRPDLVRELLLGEDRLLRVYAAGGIATYDRNR